MTGDQFIAWRKQLDLNRGEAAVCLGMAPNTVTAYERGRAIPRYIALACSALAANLEPWGESQAALDPAAE